MRRDFIIKKYKLIKFLGKEIWGNVLLKYTPNETYIGQKYNSKVCNYVIMEDERKNDFDYFGNYSSFQRISPQNEFYWEHYLAMRDDVVKYSIILTTKYLRRFEYLEKVMSWNKSVMRVKTEKMDKRSWMISRFRFLYSQGLIPSSTLKAYIDQLSWTPYMDDSDFDAPSMTELRNTPVVLNFWLGYVTLLDRLNYYWRRYEIYKFEEFFEKRFKRLRKRKKRFFKKKKKKVLQLIKFIKKLSFFVLSPKKRWYFVKLKFAFLIRLIFLKKLLRLVHYVRKTWKFQNWDFSNILKNWFNEARISKFGGFGGILLNQSVYLRNYLKIFLNKKYISSYKNKNKIVSHSTKLLKKMFFSQYLDKPILFFNIFQFFNLQSHILLLKNSCGEMVWNDSSLFGFFWWPTMTLVFNRTKEIALNFLYFKKTPFRMFFVDHVKTFIMELFSNVKNYLRSKVVRNQFWEKKRHVLLVLNYKMIRLRMGDYEDDYKIPRRLGDRFVRAKKSFDILENYRLRSFYGIFDIRPFREKYYNILNNYKYVSLYRFFQLLECRVIFLLYLMNVFPSMYFIHQILIHNYLVVNKKVIQDPNYLLDKGDVLMVPYRLYWQAVNTLKFKMFRNRLLLNVPNYLESNYVLLAVSLISFPTRYELTLPFSTSFSFFDLKNLVQTIIR